MIVYFDSAQFAWLQQASNEERASFRQVCDDLAIEAVLSLGHLTEIAQLGDATNIAHRMHILEIFPVLRSAGQSSADITGREIIQQLCLALGGGVESRLQLLDRVAPYTSTSAVAGEVQALLPQLRAVSSAFTDSAAAETAKLRIPNLAPRSLRAPTQITPEMIANARALMDSSTEDPEMRAQMYRTMEKILQNLPGATHREAMIRVSGLDGVPWIAEILDEDLAIVGAQHIRAIEVAEDVLHRIGATPIDPIALAAVLHPLGRPSTRLLLTVRRGRQRQASQTGRNDHIDEEHIAFTPYIDVMFVDKRTRHYLVTECQRHPQVCNKHELRSIAVARNLSDTVAILQARHGSARTV